MNKFIRASIISLFLLLAAYSVLEPVQRAYATATVLPQPIARFFDAAGAPLAGGQVFTYAAGTTTPLASYTDSTALVANPNPVILDSTGSAPIWISGAYKIVLEDANGNVQWTQDNIQDLFTHDQIQSTSTTSLAVQNGSPLTLTTQSGKYYGPGVFVMIVNSAAPTADYMHCPITSYIGTQLTCTPDGSLGSGTFSSWLISLSGPLGPAGPTGPTGGSGGDMVGASNLQQGVGGVANVATARTNLGLGSSAVVNAGTGASQVLQLDGSGQIPTGVFGNLTGLPVVTNSNPGKVVIGAITIEWGYSPIATAPTITFPTAFSNTPYSVNATATQNMPQFVVTINTITSSQFTTNTFGTSSENSGPAAFYWTAIGPT